MVPRAGVIVFSCYGRAHSGCQLVFRLHPRRRPSIAALLVLALLAVPGLAIATPHASSASSSPNTAVGRGFATVLVGRVTVKRKSARLPLRCTGTRHATCFVLVTMTAAVNHSRSPVGGTTVSLGAGRRATIPLPLYANGKRLLAARHRLRVQLTVETSRVKRIATATVTFRK